MGRPWITVPLASIPKPLRALVERLNGWATDKDRLEASLLKPITTNSASQSLALNKQFAVDSTRIGNTDRATLNPLDVVGSLVPTTDGTFDIGQPTGPPKRWRDGWFSRNLDVNGNLDTAGNVITGGNLTVGGTVTLSSPISGGVTISGDIIPSIDATYRLGTFVGGTKRWLEVAGLTASFELLYVASSSSPTDIAGLVVGQPGILDIGGITCYQVESNYGIYYLGLSSLANISGAGRLDIAGAGMFGGALGVTGAADFRSTVGVTGQADFAAGVSIVGGLTVGGVVRLGSTTTVGTVAIEPITTATGSLGRGVRRWALIAGTTANFTALAIGTTLSMPAGNAALPNADFAGGVTFGGVVTFNSSVSFGGGIGQDLTPSTDDTYDLGTPSIRWQELSLSGTAYLAKGTDLASGTTTTLTATGNYFDVTGTSVVSGISTPAIANGNTQFLAGTPVFLQFDGAAKLQHNATRLNLMAGVTFAAAAGDHIGLIVESTNAAGRPNFREFTRWRADGIRRQSTQANKSMGRAVLIAGVTIVANTAVTANSNIFMTPQVAGGVQGVPTVGSITAGVSFSIVSSNALDTSTVAWEVVEPEGV